MKKVLAMMMVLVMMFALCTTAMAAPDNFVSSPSGVKGPELVEFENEDEDCTADVIVTPYSERDTLDEPTKAKLEAAYQEVVNAIDLTALSDELEEVADDKNLDADNLAISDLFDISYVGCVEHDEHGFFRVLLKAEVLERFVALLHLKGDTWEVIGDAMVEDDGVHLDFHADDLSPFAIVVRTADSVDSPSTGDSGNWIIYGIILAAAVVGLVVVLFALKKKKA